MFGFESLELYTGVFGGAMIGAEALSILIKNKKNKPEKMATSEFGSKKDLKGLTGLDGLQISKEVQLNEKTCFEGVCILGPTGSGKTTTEFLPNLLSDYLPKSSIVVADPKGEQYQLTAWYQKYVCGREPILFAPLNPEMSYKYNLLENCADASEVMQLSSTLLLNGALAAEIATGKKSGGVEWIEMATPLFTASLLYCWEKGRPLNTIEQAFKLIINHDDKELDLLFSNASEDVKNQYNIFKSVGTSTNTIGGIKVTMATNLKLFTDKKLNETLKYSEFRPEELRKRPICLYVMYPERKASYLSPFTSCFFSQLIDKTIDAYTENSLPIFYFWDEFANLGQLDNMSVNAATVRSRQISLTICLQSLTQLIQVYGKANALAILNNLKTKIILPGLSDIETLNFISELAGEVEISVSSTSTNKGSTSRSFSKTKKKLLTPDEVRRLKDRELLLIMHNRQPVKDKQNCYYTQEKYLKNVNKINYPIRNRF